MLLRLLRHTVTSTGAAVLYRQSETCSNGCVGRRRAGDRRVDGRGGVGMAGTYPHLDRRCGRTTNQRAASGGGVVGAMTESVDKGNCR